MTKNRLFAVSVTLLSGFLFACPPKVEPCIFGDESGCDAGEPPPDLCNSTDEALADSQCQLTARTAISDRYLSFSGDSDYYLAQMGTLTPRSLLHVTGGYGVPATPVNFSINVLNEAGTTSVARKVDKHGQAAPKPVDIIVPFTTSNAKLFIQVGDEAAVQTPPFDVRNPYSIQFETLENPDVNEPNDTTPTVIPVSPAGAESTGQGTGMLATDDDLDLFTFTVPSTGSARKILYLHLTMPRLTPAAPYRLSYRLLDDLKVPVAEGQVANEFIAVDLATARLVKPGVAYTLEITGYRSVNTVGPIPGDVRPVARYTVDLRFMDDLDPNEPNETVTTAKAVSMAVGNSQTFTGRIAYVPDPDWYRLDLAATGNPTVLSLRLRAGTGGGRFPALSAPSDRQLRVGFGVTTGANVTDRQVNCKNDQTVCPKGFDPQDTSKLLLVEAQCTSFDPPMCLMGERNEDPKWQQMRNFDINIPVPPHGGAAVSYFVVVQDDGNNWADDLNYDLTVRYLADPDDAARLSSPAQVTSVVESASFPAPPTTGEVTGELTFGYGRVVNHDLLQGEGIRAPQDYDAVPSDFDRFRFDFPAVSTPYDRTWSLQWVVDHLPDGGPPGDLVLEAQFCDTTLLADGGCGITRNIGWIAGRVQPWYSSNFSDRAVIWDKQVVGNTTVVTAQAAGCFCLEPRSVVAGAMFANVGAFDRNSPDPITYRVRMGLAPYPLSYTADGGSVSCPAAPGDGGAGCGFTGTP